MLDKKIVATLQYRVVSDTQRVSGSSTFLKGYLIRVCTVIILSYYKK